LFSGVYVIYLRIYRGFLLSQTEEGKEYTEKEEVKFPSYRIIPYIQWCTQKFFSGWGSTNSVGRRQREQGSGGGSPPLRGSAKFASG
jgi:hypothetical protein